MRLRLSEECYLSLLHQEGDVEKVLDTGAEAGRVDDELEEVDGLFVVVLPAGDEALHHVSHHHLRLILRLLRLKTRLEEQKRPSSVKYNSMILSEMP